MTNLSQVIKILEGTFSLHHKIIILRTVNEEGRGFMPYNLNYPKQKFQFTPRLLLPISSNEVMGFSEYFNEISLINLETGERKVFKDTPSIIEVTAIGNSKVIINASYGYGKLSLLDLSAFGGSRAEEGKEIGSFGYEGMGSKKNYPIYNDLTGVIVVLNSPTLITAYDYSSFEKGKAVIRFTREIKCELDASGNKIEVETLVPFHGTQKFLYYDKRKVRIASITNTEIKDESTISIEGEIIHIITLSNERVLIYYGGPEADVYQLFYIAVYDVSKSPSLIFENKEFESLNEKIMLELSYDEVLLCETDYPPFILNLSTGVKKTFDLPEGECLKGACSYIEYSSENRKIFRCILELKLKFLPKDLINEIFTFF
jgi:hypothetical protein